MHICFRQLCSKIDGKSRNRANSLSDRFDDAHQEFLLTHSHPPCVKLPPWQPDVNSVTFKSTHWLDNPCSLSWKQVYQQPLLLSEVYGRSLNVNETEEGTRCISYSPSEIDFYKLNSCLIQNALGDRIQVWDMLYHCLRDKKVSLGKTSREVCADFINNNGLMFQDNDISWNLHLDTELLNRRSENVSGA